MRDSEVNPARSATPVRSRGENPHALPAVRLSKVALRTAHLMATSILVGGYAFSAPGARLLSWLCAAIATGVAMIFYEAYPFHTSTTMGSQASRGLARLGRTAGVPGTPWDFLFEGWGLMLLAKLALLCTLGFAGRARLPILLAAVAVASIGSHMPRRWRHYSVLHRRVMR